MTPEEKRLERIIDYFIKGEMTMREYAAYLENQKFIDRIKEFEVCCLFYKKSDGKYYVLPIFNYYTEKYIKELISKIVQQRFIDKIEDNSGQQKDLSILNYTHGKGCYQDDIRETLLGNNHDFIIYNNDLATFLPKFYVSTNKGMEKRSKVGQKVQECLLKTINDYNNAIKNNGKFNPLLVNLNYNANSKGDMYMYIQMKNFIKDNKNELMNLLQSVKDINIEIDNLPFFFGHKPFVPSINETYKIFKDCCCEDNVFTNKLNKICIGRSDDSRAMLFGIIPLFKLHKMKGCKVFLDNLIKDKSGFEKIKSKLYVAENIKKKLRKRFSTDKQLNNFLDNTGTCDEYLSDIVEDNKYKTMINNNNSNYSLIDDSNISMIK